MDSPLAGGSGVAWGDYDNDGWPDLFAVNYGDFRLYHNNQDGTFTNVAATAGIAGNGECSPAWADYDNDSDLDLYVGCMSGSVAGYLFRNNGDATFTDVREAAWLNLSEQNRPVAWGDYDNDGWLDLFVAEPSAGRSCSTTTRGDGTFSDGSLAAHLGSGSGYTGAAWGDYDGDGWLDLFIGNDGTPNLLYHNLLASSENHWLQVKLLGTLSNVSGIGARVRVVAGGLAMNREVSGGSGFYSQNSLPAEFGLGTYTGTVTVEVYWPSGQLDLLSGVASDQVITVTESTGRLHDLEMTDVLPAGARAGRSTVHSRPPHCAIWANSLKRMCPCSVRSACWAVCCTARRSRWRRLTRLYGSKSSSRPSLRPQAAIMRSPAQLCWQATKTPPTISRR